MAEVVTKGVGRVERTADRAEVQVSFEATGSTRAEAVDRLTGRVAALEPAFARPGVEVRSRQLTVNDNWDGSRRSGGRASQNYVVRVDDVTVLDELLAAAVAAPPPGGGGPGGGRRGGPPAGGGGPGGGGGGARRGGAG
ncbi:SIMPL domain-containing protein, partial [Saccharothrix sp. MB29]|nr:SIMPL domain-containing protein [Saccharothrix sp. MB29]